VSVDTVVVLVLALQTASGAKQKYNSIRPFHDRVEEEYADEYHDETEHAEVPAHD
jgi:hypothetical protein